MRIAVFSDGFLGRIVAILHECSKLSHVDC